ncbi:MAG: NAD(P)/FAD-dependent oxidoreductase [Planctomycetota bacterium]
MQRVVIIGGGFAGLEAARRLSGEQVDVTVIDRRNHHLFQPLLYQVATAGLEPSQVSTPIRTVLAGKPNVRVVMAEAEGVDAKAKQVRTSSGVYEYDWLVLAAGARSDYFGNESWRDLAPGLKSIEDAIDIRRRFLTSYELAEQEEDDAERRRLMTFVVIGAGATGIELAGALAEIASKCLPPDFSRADTSNTRIVLIEGGPRVLSAFHERLSARCRKDLERMGVEVRVDTFAREISEESVELEHEGERETIECGLVLWGAGVEAEPIAKTVGVSHAKDGRVVAGPDLSVPGYPEVFVVGDIAKMDDGQGKGTETPGVAQGGIQSGKHAASIIAHEVRHGVREPSERPAFRYFDKGNMATIGRRRAIAEIGPFKFGGVFAWVLWGVVHVLFLIGFRNKLFTMLEWMWAYVTFGRGARIITGPPAPRPEPRHA